MCGPDSANSKDVAITAWNALPRHDDPPRWIPLAERVPDNKQRVLVWHVDEISFARWYMRNDRGAFFDDVGELLLAWHWMPLPSPPTDPLRSQV
jgi:hypothetical protein